MDASSRGFRIKLDLSELICGQMTRSWYYVDRASCKTIDDLKRTITVRFHLKYQASELEVRLQDFIIPSDESIDVLQPEDLLILRRTIQLSCHSPSNITGGSDLRAILQQNPPLLGERSQSFDADTRNAVETEQLIATSKNKKKKKKKSKHCHSDREENQTNLESPPNKSKKRTSKDSEKKTVSLSAESQRSHKDHTKKSKQPSVPDTELPSETPEVNKAKETIQPDDSFSIQDLQKKRRKRKRKQKNAESSFKGVNFFNGHENGENVAAYDPDYGTPRPCQPPFKPAFYSEGEGKHIRFDEESSSCDHSLEIVADRATESQILNSKIQTRNELYEAIGISRQKTPVVDNPNGQNSSTAPIENLIQNVQDLSQYPTLNGHPRVKDIVAYKVLELSEDYMPKVSDYIVGRVIEIDSSSKAVTIRFLTPMKSKPRRGKFELTEGDFEEEETEEEIITTSATVEWHFVIEARLLPESIQLSG